MTEGLFISPGLAIPMAEVEFSFARSSGPGGQNVNKVSSKAILRFNVVRSPSLSEAVRRRFLERFASRINTDGVLLLTCSNSASQHQNRQECLARLQAMLQDAATPPKVRVKTRPSRASKQRRVQAKKRQSAKKAGRGKNWSSSEE